MTQTFLGKEGLQYSYVLSDQHNIPNPTKSQKVKLF